MLKYKCDETNTYTLWTYFGVVSVVCFVWEFLYRLMNKYKCNKKTPVSVKRVGYSIMSATISLIAFQSTMFYMDDNNVFNCFMDYDEAIANALFFITYGIIVLLAIIENYCYPNFSQANKISQTAITS